MVFDDCLWMIGLFYVFHLILLIRTVSVDEDSLCNRTLAWVRFVIRKYTAEISRASGLNPEWSHPLHSPPCVFRGSFMTPMRLGAELNATRKNCREKRPQEFGHWSRGTSDGGRRPHSRIEAQSHFDRRGRKGSSATWNSHTLVRSSGCRTNSPF